MTKINSNNIIKSPQGLGYIRGAHPRVSISQLLRLLEAPAKLENLEWRWIFLWVSLPLGPAVAVNSLMMPPPGIPPHLTPPQQECWHCNWHMSPLSCLSLKNLERRRLLSILLVKDWLLTDPSSPTTSPPYPAGLQEHAEHPCLEKGQRMERWVSNQEWNHSEICLGHCSYFFCLHPKAGNLC